MTLSKWSIGDVFDSITIDVISSHAMGLCAAWNANVWGFNVRILNFSRFHYKKYKFLYVLVYDLPVIRHYSSLTRVGLVGVYCTCLNLNAKVTSIRNSQTSICICEVPVFFCTFGRIVSFWFFSTYTYFNGIKKPNFVIVQLQL